MDTFIHTGNLVTMITREKKVPTLKVFTHPYPKINLNPEDPNYVGGDNKAS